MQLYKLVNQYKQISNMAEEIDEQTLIDTLESIEEGINDKAENIAKLIRTWELETFMIKEEEKRLATKRKTIENKTKNLKEYLQKQLELYGVDKINSPTFNISLRLSPPKVNILDESQIPLQFYTIPTPTISKTAIANTIKAGMTVPGAELIQEKGLQIK